MRLGLLPLLCLLPLALSASVLEQRHPYQIHVDKHFNQMTVAACFERRVPETLLAASNDASRLLRDPHIIVDGDKRPLRVMRNRMTIPSQPDDLCVHYAVDLGLAARSRSLGIAARTGDALVLSPRIWLWRPRRLTRYADIELSFDLPPEFSLSTPWPRIGEDSEGRPRFRLDHPPLGWDSSIAIGRFETFTLHNDDIQVDVALANGPSDPPPPSSVEAWLQPGLDAAATIFGGFPGHRAQVIVVPLDSGDRPLAQGRVSRAGGMGLLLGMSTSRPESDYHLDGLVAHEFMHLLHPPVIPHHRWLSEGIASYYQYIGLARAGHLSEAEAWQRLLADMYDGYWDRRQGTLRDITMRMSGGGADYVYWAGAALMLMSDVALRSREEDATTLDHVLAEWARCCFHERRAHDGRDSLRRLDKFAGGEPVFAPLYDEHVLSTRFPDISALLQALGLPELGEHGEDFQLDDDAPLVSIRRAIMRAHDRPLLDTPREE
ncbi:hypothetical protein [Natronospira bacteriovora]|uniref:Peptidase M61 catalytic domain-containing protein n=1 Tax=Natronospira bacteriovora TaxID=3069753 RepID=A0ABU0WAC7_9GAMM|nr:hypothetical protein [Natronospira sp. AB-CW4]MDQ2070874.1 hypothetical protein [Natronospira sp. AB-CW4]